MTHAIDLPDTKDHRARFPHPLESLFITTTTTCNFRCVFCAYGRSNLPHQRMPLDDFVAYIDQATQLGYRAFNLTPIQGEPLTDPLLLQRLAFLDGHAAVGDYGFCTNLALGEEDLFQALAGLRKLRWLSISIYGHNEESFLAVAGSNTQQYRRLLDGLSALSLHEGLLPRIDLKIRTVRDFSLDTCNSDLVRAIKLLADKGARVRIPGGLANWSGLVDTERLEGLNLHAKQAVVTKTEPCAYLFKPVVLPDGRVNACPVGDGNTTLNLGNLHQDSLRYILSTANQRYMDLIRSHLGSCFPAACQGCTSYRGISQTGFSYQFHRRPHITLGECLDWLASNVG